MSNLIIVPARQGIALRLAAGSRCRVINTHGAQVVDTWAFAEEDLNECMSMEHTRTALTKLRPHVGDALFSSARRPILTLTEDTSPGAHDTLMAACDDARYRALGCREYHDNCQDNLAAALKVLGLYPPKTPSPLNLFMNIPWTNEGALSFEPPTTRPGDYVTFLAHIDLVMAFSACPQDILPINGVARSPTEAHVEILD